MSDDLLQKAVQKLVQKEPGWQQFVQPEARGAKPAEVGRSAAPAAAGSGGGAEGNLVETDYSQRTHHPEQTLATSDGYVVLVISPPKRIYFMTEDERTVYHEFKAPPAP